MPPKIDYYKKNNNSSKVAYTIYDCSIENVEERKEKAIHFDSATALADYLGMFRVHIPRYTSRMAIAAKKRFMSKKQGGKEFAIRLTKK